jgi:hypothetical protein
MAGYSDFANSERQKQIAELMDEGLSSRKIAEKVGGDSANVRSAMKAIRARAAKKGHAPEHDMHHTVPEGYAVKGTSTLYKEGQPVLQWVKTNQDAERQLELMQEAIAALAQDLPKLPASLPYSNEEYAKQLMAVYPLGDPHIGVLSWAEETGQDWDLTIAEGKFCAAFDRIVNTAPACEEAVIVNLGDFFHSDNMEGVTSRSGHHLDMDGRFAKMVRVGMKIMRQMIDSALNRHKHVRVINATGNHDDTSSMFLAVALSNIYENEPRVTIDDSPTPFHYVEWGACMFGVHHGHSCKPAMLPGVMAADQPEMWGRTKYRYWYTGHIHHDSKKEFAGVTQESFRTLAAKDAYATWGGYRSGQDTKCIVLHKEFGEVERHTVNLSMI